MDIAAMSMDMAQFQVQQQASYSIAGKAMDAMEVELQGLLNMVNQAQPVQMPPSSHLLDVRV